MAIIKLNEACASKARTKKVKAKKTVKGSCSTKFKCSKSSTKG